MTPWVNFRENNLHKHELQLSDYNMEKYFRPNVQISGRKIFFSFPILAYKFFKVKSKNCKYQKCIFLGQNTFPYCSWITVVLVYVNIFYLNFNQYATIL